ncbi:FecR family protein [Dyadobacter sp. CY312]|uniref:FecR family protein n=1 Tax=Dyadobacter sp. CY312 TaxID=2907303 RepID=UPI001F35F70F|nr:FecR family protein [Dyadobacter sp. CY312]MCE7043262.1 FecR domain-containing protein [Dyadobacter sp. CY312]
MKENSAKKDLLRMLNRYADGIASPAEKKFVEKYYDRFDKESDILDQYTVGEKADLENEMEAFLTARIRAKEENIIKPFWSKSVFRLLAAASVLFVLGILVYKSERFFAKNEHQIAIAPTDVAPGSDRAILTLSNGTSITLDNKSEGYLATEGKVSIRSNGHGELRYTSSGIETDKNEAGVNRISTPVGGQYRVVLPDGSKVWLNAMSSLSYPTFFEGTQRKVRVTGECYFEIARDTKHPFVVEIDSKQEVVVTGTHFNVNAYPNESNIRTTLLEGGVEVYRIGDSSRDVVKLKPGMQSFVGANNMLKTREVNAEEMVAWKNGLFYFDNADVPAVMRQVERWYNVEVAYKKEIESKAFSGKIHRTANLSQIVEILRFSGVNVQVEPTDKKDVNARIVLNP